MEKIYDFIVIGAGPAGCVVASRLARSVSRPSVLLLEAGGVNDSLENLSGAERLNLAFTPNSPLNWNYKTVAQTHLKGQEIDYSRGKGLGGSTAINFCGWIVGPRDDYEEWARQVKDESFNWAQARRCLDKIENLDSRIPNEQLKKYINANIKAHSSTGSVPMTYGESWVHDIGDIYTAAEQSGLPINKDVNSGDPIGMGMGTVCIAQGRRVTSATAYLSRPPPNLTILPGATVARVLFETKRAVGVETVDGRKFTAESEIIVSSGALNTPKILMLSGIGPADQLEQHNIPLIYNLPLLGKNLQDHCYVPVGIVMRRSEAPPAHEPLSQSPNPMGWIKLPKVLNSKEFASLSKDKQDFLRAPTTPTIEIVTHIPPHFVTRELAPDTRFLGVMCLLFNPESRGSVTLQSADPEEAPLLDPKFLTNKFDRGVIVEGVREMMRVLSAPVYAADTIEKFGPDDDSDESIWEYVQRNIFSSWHMASTARMGTDSASACVDSKFRVFGLEKLRIVDLSVCPFVPNNHTQSTAYVVGEMASEKLIVEYGL